MSGGQTLWELAKELRGIPDQLSPGNPLAQIVRETTEVCAERVEQWAREADRNWRTGAKATWTDGTQWIGHALADLGVPKEV